MTGKTVLWVWGLIAFLAGPLAGCGTSECDLAADALALEGEERDAFVEACEEGQEMPSDE